MVSLLDPLLARGRDRLETLRGKGFRGVFSAPTR